VGDEGRLDVDQVELLAAQLGQMAQDRAQLHAPVLRVEQHLVRRHTLDARFVARFAPVRRCDQHALVAELRKLTAKALDGRGDPVDTGEVHVREHQNLHSGRSPG
jgi:hypothetical protein